MKVTNVLGNDYTGTIGDAVTASHWKGRNYLKKWFKPANPQSIEQTKVRNHWKAAVAQWQVLNALKKAAYGHKARYDKLQITAFNTMVKSYMDLVLAGLAYDEPTAGFRFVKDVTNNNPIEGALFIVKKAGQSTEYMRVYSDVSGNANGALCAEDENYECYITAVGYLPYFLGEKAAFLIFQGGNIPLTPVP